MCQRPLHFMVQNGWVNVSLYNITYKNNKEYFLIVTVAVTVNVARVTVIVMVIVIVCLFCIVSHTQWQSCEWCGWFANSSPHWTYEQVSINKRRCFLQIAIKKNCSLFSICSKYWDPFSVLFFLTFFLQYQWMPPQDGTPE